MFDFSDPRSLSPVLLQGDNLPVAIVGGGFSGTIVALLLARSSVPSILIDGSGRAGKGVAYSTADPIHLLNVPSNRMSAFPDQPDHFDRFHVGQGGTSGSFAQRRAYGAYLRSLLDGAVASGAVKLVAGEAISARFVDGRWVVGIRDGEPVQAEKLVLATGNQAPGGFPQFAGAGRNYLANPWSGEARATLDGAATTAGSILMVGTGLTMIDTALSLQLAGFSGKMTALSRRGLLPQPHVAFDPAPVDFDDLPSGSLAQMWRWMRARNVQVGWRSAVESLRPHTARIWQTWSMTDRRRFLRHARPWWEILRHRIAPQIGNRLSELIRAGQLEVIAGNVKSVTAIGGALAVGIRRRGKAAVEVERYDLVVNCTGPLHRLSETTDPLLRDLLDQGLIAPDALDIGPQLAARAKVAGAPRLWAVGPLTKGHYWEITAVPDIREQAAAVANEIIEELAHVPPQQPEFT